MRRDSSDASSPGAVSRISPAAMKNRGSLMPKSPEEKVVDDTVDRVNAARTLGDEKRNEALERLLNLAGEDKYKQPLLRAGVAEICCSAIKEEATGAASKATAFTILARLVQPKGINIMDTPGLAAATLACLQAEGEDSDVYASCIGFLFELGKVQQINMNKNPGLVEELFKSPNQGPLMVLDAIAKKPENALLIHSSSGFATLLAVIGQETPGSEVGAITLLATLSGVESIASKLFRTPRLVDLVVTEIASDRLFADSAVQAFRFLWGLANVEADLGQNSAVIRQAVRVVTEEEAGSPVRQRALGLLRGMALYPTNHDAMYAVPGIIEGLTAALRSEEPGSQSHVLALQVLSLMTTDTAEAVLEEPLLVLVLQACSREDLPETRAEAFGLLWALSEAPRLAEDKRVIEVCSRAIANENPASPVRRNAVGTVRGMAENDVSRDSLAATPGLMISLIGVVRSEPKGSETKALALMALRDLTSETSLKALPLDYLQLLQDVVKQETDKTVRLSALGALGKIAFVGTAETGVRIVTETGLVDYLESVLKGGVVADQIAALGVVCNLASAREPAEALAKRPGFVGLIVSLVSDKSQVSSQAVAALHNFSKHVAIRAQLTGAVDRIAPLARKGDAFASLALFNLVGSDPSKSSLVNNDMLDALAVYLTSIVDEDSSGLQLELSEPLISLIELVEVPAYRARLSPSIAPLLVPRALDLALQWNDDIAFVLAVKILAKLDGNVPSAAGYSSKAEAKGWSEAAAVCKGSSGANNGSGSAAAAPVSVSPSKPVAAAAPSADGTWKGGVPQTESDVSQWLRSVQLAALVDSFAHEGIDGSALRSLHEHWAETNVPSMFKCKAGDALRLRTALNGLFGAAR